MATIIYTIALGTAGFTVTINPAVAPPNTHLAAGTYTFVDIPDGSYTVTVTDNSSCQASFEVHIDCSITTTIAPTTTTTSTTSIPVTTTTTTTIPPISGEGILFTGTWNDNTFYKDSSFYKDQP